MHVNDSINTTKVSGTKYGISNYDEPEALVTPMRANGDPDRVARVCSGSRKVDYKTEWYCLPATPSFLICTWCYMNYIRPTGLVASFQKVTKDEGRCRFLLPRLTNALWPAAQRMGDLTAMQDYMSRRLSIPDCKGFDGAVFAEKIKWFTFTSLEIDGFVVCEACYEDHILDSPFAKFFGPYANAQTQGSTWACDLHYGYIKRSFKILSQMSDANTRWAEFLAGARKRFALPRCEGKGVPVHTLTWYRPRQKVANLDFCEACYMDHMAMTAFEKEAEPVIKTREITAEMRMCDFHLVSVKEALSVCHKKHLSFDTFIDAAKVIAGSPRCSAAQGIVDGKWHDLQPPVPNFGVCEGCYTGILVAHGVSHFWNSTPTQSAPGSEELCAFNPRVPRFNSFINRWNEAIETGVWSPYDNYVRKWAPIPVCDRYEQVMSRTWYGWPECTICEDCYLSFAEGTTLARFMPLQKTLLESKNMCYMYSPRMRERYTAACASMNMEELLAACRERVVVYQNTVPELLTLRRKTERDRMAARSKIALSFQYSTADTVIDLFSSPRVKYGNSDIGYYSTSSGYEGAQMYNEGMEGLSRANDPELLTHICNLQTRWDAVE
ncbi:hypothetical protein GQ53DRAFT_647132 [Thozetella sp. PMI_491]|nr:hypothetical protein GQ53DRAFT_647132 [Thozetella sp. PMI_491]